MKTVLKWIGIVLGGLLALIVVIAIGLAIYGETSFKARHANRPLYAITADTSPEGLARGEYLLSAVMGCAGACHTGADGRPFVGTTESINEEPIAVVFAVPNLTPDEATGLGSWTDAEIARAIREGIDKDGVELVVMPAFNYHALSDADVAAIIGYLRSLEPVRNEIPPFQANTVAKIMLALGMFGPETVGEPITVAQAAPPAGSAEYGGYLTSLGACRDCHGVNLAGGEVPFAEPGAPPASNLTPAGELAGWSEGDFITAIRTGVTPSGRTLDPEAMPWRDYGKMTDDDLAAIFKYLKTLPRVESNQ